MKKYLFFLAPILLLFLLEGGLYGINQLLPWDRMVRRLGLVHREFLIQEEQDAPRQFYRDPDLFWIRRPSDEDPEFRINNLGFRGRDIHPDKTPGTYRIACLGNSCTQGYYVDKNAETYVSRLETRLNENYINQQFEVINAGVEGYTSYQMLNLWRKKVAGLNPDIITLYATCNDIVYAPISQDKDIRMPALVCNLANTLLSLRSFRFMQALTKRAQSWLGGGMYVSPYHEKTGMLRRVSADDFRDNLAKLVQEASTQKVIMVLATAPIRGYYPLVYYPYPEIQQKGGKPIVNWIQGNRVSKNLMQRLDLDRNYQAVLSEALHSISVNPVCPSSYFIAGHCYQALQDTGQASRYFHLADSLDEQRHMVNRYNQIAREVASEYQVPLVDLEKIFGEGDNADLFAGDGYHPNPAGHALIAEAFYPVLLELITK